jgi:hypothetical protein
MHLIFLLLRLLFICILNLGEVFRELDISKLFTIEGCTVWFACRVFASVDSYSLPVYTAEFFNVTEQLRHDLNL